MFLTLVICSSGSCSSGFKVPLALVVHVTVLVFVPSKKKVSLCYIYC